MTIAQAEQDNLTRRASRLLAAGNALDALRIAEGLCRRVPRTHARHLLLRAMASFELGDGDAARADLDRALDVDATDFAVADMVLRMGRESDAALRQRAAHIVVASARSPPGMLIAALEVILSPASPVIARGRLAGGRIEGWVAWLGADSIDVCLRCDDGAEHGFALASVPDHSLASPARRAASFSRDAPSGALPQLAWTIKDSSSTATTALVREPRTTTLPRRLDFKPATATRGLGCSVIVPIFADPLATARCLDSLAAQSLDCPLTVIMVNDRPADETIRILVERAAACYGFRLVVNRANLGFVGAVEAGIAAAPAEYDIVLVNADTILPKDALRRLAVAAHSSPEIGTVTPLSNNGELTSFPRPFIANPIGNVESVGAIDAIAWRVNAGMLVPITNGIGFCLFVKRACLDAVGGFPDAYHRGYFEDVELCLRAREAGYTNVCATGIYVGHVGSRSFGEEKKVLVARNVKILKRRYPCFLEDGLAFVKADPLHAARDAIAWERPPTATRSRLVVCASPRSFALFKRVRRLRRSGKSVFTLTRVCPSRRALFVLNSIDFDLHHDSGVDLASARDCARLLARLQSIGISRVDIIDEPNLEPAFAASLSARFPTSLVLSRLPLPPSAIASSSSGLTDLSPLARRRRTIALDPMVLAVLGGSAVSHSPRCTSRIRRRRRVVLGDALGILCPDPDAAGEALLRRVVGGLVEELCVVVIGRTFSDAAFTAHPRVFITGPVSHDGYEDLLDRCRVGLLASLDRHNGFGLVSWLSGSTGRPAAYFDWSRGRMTRRTCDLALDPAIGDHDVSERLLAWAATRLGGDLVQG